MIFRVREKFVFLKLLPCQSQKKQIQQLTKTEPKKKMFEKGEPKSVLNETEDRFNKANIFLNQNLSKLRGCNFGGPKGKELHGDNIIGAGVVHFDFEKKFGALIFETKECLVGEKTDAPNLNIRYIPTDLIRPIRCEDDFLKISADILEALQTRSIEFYHPFTMVCYGPVPDKLRYTTNYIALNRKFGAEHPPLDRIETLIEQYRPRSIKQIEHDGLSDKTDTSPEHSVAVHANSFIFYFYMRLRDTKKSH